MSKNKPSYYAILPSNVRYDNRLNANEKIMYSEITALTQSTGQCWASNRYFADLYKVTPQAISKWIKKIEKLGYIKITYVYKEGTKMIEKRFIRLVSIDVSDVSLEVEGGINSDLGGYQQPIKDNNTSINNTSNNINTIVEKKELDDIPYQEIIDYLNEIVGSRYRNTSNNQTVIRARWNDGFRLDDFKKVIDIKNAEWSTDKDMAKYLRPITLFGTKFESYLNQPVAKKELSMEERNKLRYGES